MPARYSLPPAPICFRLVSLDAEDGHNVAERGELVDELRAQEQSVGREKKHDVRKLPRNVDDLRARQRLPARDHEEGDAQLISLRDYAAHFLGRQLVRRIAPDGLRVAALASQVALIGDADSRVGNASRSFGPSSFLWPPSWCCLGRPTSLRIVFRTAVHLNAAAGPPGNRCCFPGPG
jgi:hypothetical protein